MIQIKDETLIIEIVHPCPEEFKNDLKEAIISSIQNQDVKCIGNSELHENNCTLLELLKNLF
jgi:hypothetical protein